MCDYPVNSTWLKVVKAGNYIGWLLITEGNVSEYYLEIDKMPKGHLNQVIKYAVNQALAASDGDSQHNNVARPQSFRHVHQSM